MRLACCVLWNCVCFCRRAPARQGRPARARPNMATRDPRFRAQFIGTRACRFFRDGHCTNSQSCAFAHGEVREAPDLRKTSLCKAWLSRKTGGGCGQGLPLRAWLLGAQTHLPHAQVPRAPEAPALRLRAPRGPGLALGSLRLRRPASATPAPWLECCARRSPTCTKTDGPAAEQGAREARDARA